jgi:F-type H+-transporting ATPase subunit alpha
VEDVLRFERELLDYLARHTEILTTLRDTNVLDDGTVAALGAGIDAFKLEFQTGEGKPLASVGTERFPAIAPEEVIQEKIVKTKR